MQTSTIETIYNTRKCIFCDIKFLNFLGGDVPEPLLRESDRSSRPTPVHPLLKASKTRAFGAQMCLSPPVGEYCPPVGVTPDATAELH